jgi:hypothetical protein
MSLGFVFMIASPYRKIAQKTSAVIIGDGQAQSNRLGVA